MLVRLRPRALARVDHEQEEVDPGRAGDHRADEPLVPGHVDHRQPPPVGQLERRVAEVDRDPAPLLLRKAVRVLAGERPDEPRLAVVDVPGGADVSGISETLDEQRQGCPPRGRAAPRAGRTLAPRRSASPGVAGVGIGRTERLDLQVLDAACPENASPASSRLPSPARAGPPHAHHVHLGRGGCAA